MMPVNPNRDANKASKSSESSESSMPDSNEVSAEDKAKFDQANKVQEKPKDDQQQKDQGKDQQRGQDSSGDKKGSGDGQKSGKEQAAERSGIMGAWSRNILKDEAVKKQANEAAADSLATMAMSIQNAIIQGSGKGEAVAAAGKGAAEMMEQINKMVDKFLINDPKFSKSDGARLTLSGAENANLKGVEVVINVEKGEMGNKLSVQFMAQDKDTSDYIHQNMAELENQLQKDLKSFTDIDVGVETRDQGQQQDQTGRDRGSREEYIPEEPDENK